jgi:hypothetical protein
MHIFFAMDQIRIPVSGVRLLRFPWNLGTEIAFIAITLQTRFTTKAPRHQGKHQGLLLSQSHKDTELHTYLATD